MRALMQRVDSASVSVEGNVIGACKVGWLVFLGVSRDDGEKQVAHIARKISKLRAFPDSDGKMNLSLEDIAGSVLVVSQFTLYADTNKGNRPSFAHSAPKETAQRLYELLIEALRSRGILVATGKFGAPMQITAQCNGPVTIMLDFS